MYVNHEICGDESMPCESYPFQSYYALSFSSHTEFHISIDYRITLANVSFALEPTWLLPNSEVYRNSKCILGCARRTFSLSLFVSICMYQCLFSTNSRQSNFETVIRRARVNWSKFENSINSRKKNGEKHNKEKKNHNSKSVGIWHDKNLILPWTF